MKAIFLPAYFSVYVLSIDYVDLDNFEDQFKPILLENKNIKGHPVFLAFNTKSDDRISELSMLVDSLKDLDLLIAGVVSQDSSVRKFADFLGLPNFKSVDEIEVSAKIAKPPVSANSLPVKKLEESATGSHVPMHSTNILRRAKTTNPDGIDSEQTNLHVDSSESSLTTRANNRTQALNAKKSDDYNYQQEAKRWYSPVNDEKVNSQFQTQTEQMRYIQNHPLRSRFETDAQRESLANPRNSDTMKVPNMPKKSSIQINSVDDKKPSLPKQAQTPLIVRETVKSGQNVKYEGDLVLLGNSEKGSVINVTGSIYCYSEARGTLLAGSKGNGSARIYACGLQAEAIAISGLYVKYEQFAELLRGQKIIMAAKNSYEDKIDFSRLNEMPSIVTNAQDPVRSRANNDTSRFTQQSNADVSHLTRSQTPADTSLEHLTTQQESDEGIVPPLS